MHIEKYKTDQATGIILHNTRERKGHYGNERIDPSRSYRNEHLLPPDEALQLWKDRVKEIKKEYKETTGREMKSNTVTLCSLVVTLPEEYKKRPEKDQKEFFKAVDSWCRQKYPESIYSSIHMDETSPHIHYGFLPLVAGRFNARELISRKNLNGLHDNLDVYLKKHVGWYRGGVVNPDPTERMKSQHNMAMDEFNRVMDKKDEAEKYLARTLQTAEELRHRAIDPDLVDRVEKGKHVSRKEVRQLLGEAQRGIDLQRREKDIDNKVDHLKDLEKESAERESKLQEYEKRLQQRADNLTTEREIISSREIEVSAREGAVGKKEYAFACGVREYGDVLQTVGDMFYTSMTTEATARKKAGLPIADYANSVPVINHDSQKERYEKLRAEADPILKRHEGSEVRLCTPFSELKKRLSSFVKTLTHKITHSKSKGFSMEL